jgi:hypothetical protein
MKNLVLFFGFFTLLHCKAGKLVIEGKFQNKNLFVHNSVAQGGVGFCAKEVKVNGVVTTDETNSTAFEIDLISLGLKFGEAIIIEITHSDGCVPKVLNPEDLKPKPTFEVLTMNITGDGTFEWTTKNEMGSLPFIVEHFKWNKWVAVGEVEGAGTPGKHTYAFKVIMHSGENKIRVRQRGFNSATKVSPEMVVKSELEKPTYTMLKNRITFSKNTSFEIYDIYGMIVKTGFGKLVTTDKMKKGKYYLCYDNEVTEIKM